jgi:hypothetical protein
MDIWLFYVTLLQVFFLMEFGGVFCGFVGLFEGGSEKTTDLVWCFDGEFVVSCVADVVVRQPTFHG